MNKTKYINTCMLYHIGSGKNLNIIKFCSIDDIVNDASSCVSVYYRDDNFLIYKDKYLPTTRIHACVYKLVPDFCDNDLIVKCYPKVLSKEQMNFIRLALIH